MLYNNLIVEEIDANLAEGVNVTLEKEGLW